LNNNAFQYNSEYAYFLGEGFCKNIYSTETGMISVTDLDDISNMIDEDLYLIEDDDGIQKVVSSSYIDKAIEKI
jgi:hypothetical protein